MTSVDCSTCAILKRVIPGRCPETRRGVDKAIVEETIPISCRTSLSETITILPEKDSPGVREDEIEDGAKRCTSRDVTVM
jgi:hypothetical protein